MKRREPVLAILMLAAGAALGITVIRYRREHPTLNGILDRCEVCAEALDKRLNWVSELCATEKTATR